MTTAPPPGSLSLPLLKRAGSTRSGRISPSGPSQASLVTVKRRSWPQGCQLAPAHATRQPFSKSLLAHKTPEPKQKPLPGSTRPPRNNPATPICMTSGSLEIRAVAGLRLTRPKANLQSQTQCSIAFCGVHRVDRDNIQPSLVTLLTAIDRPPLGCPTQANPNPSFEPAGRSYIIPRSIWTGVDHSAAPKAYTASCSRSSTLGLALQPSIEQRKAQIELAHARSAMNRLAWPYIQKSGHTQL